MTPDAWLTAAVLVLVLIGLWREIATPLILIFSGLVALLLLDVVEPEEALTGFSNPAPFSVGALFVVAAAVSKTGALDALTVRLMGTTGHTRKPMLKLLTPTTLSSAIVSNTPIVAMLIPQITAWSRRMGRSASMFLMPLSFAALLGGMLTVIGTSTNLVVAGQMDDAGLEPFAFFETGIVGLPLAVLGVGLLVYLAPRMLGRRRPAGEAVDEPADHYMIEIEVTRDGPMDGLTVEQAGLRHLDGLFLAAVRRTDTTIAPATPKTILRGGNRLQFVGQIDKVIDLRAKEGLDFVELGHVIDLESPNVGYFLAVLGGDSPAIGMTLKEIGFRSRYQAAAIGIQRDGVSLGGKLGEIPLHIGDTLILVSDTGFRDRWSRRRDFLLIDPIGPDRPTRSPGSVRTLTILGVFIAATATGLVPILQASLAAALAMIVIGVLTADEARRAVDIEVVGVIASAFGLASAITASGLDIVISDGVIGLFDGLGPTWILVGVSILAIILTELVTNNAAALLVFPIAIAAAPAADLDPRGMALAVAIAASASFLTPIGYQTNTMVYGPGGYRFSDYARLGAPLTLLVIVAIALIVPAVYSV
jgi:di/tricarboxylate transporter